MAHVLGIDLGTTNSVAAFLDNGEPTVIPNAEGKNTTPSVVAFTKTGDTLVGDVAKRQAVTNADRTFRSIKRFMGEKKTSNIDGTTYSPQEISARTLMKLKRDAEAFLGETVTQAVITVPAYFSDSQRQSTKEAGRIAGLEVLRIINEPTAAALAYGLDKDAQDQTILVFDLGGGTFDVSVLELGGGVFEVKSTSGDTDLGGDDWDNALVDLFLERFKAEHDLDLSRDKIALQRLRDAAETTKIELSQAPSSSVNLPYLTAGPAGPLHLETEVTRAEFEEASAALRTRLEKPVLDALAQAELTAADLNHVVMVGGSTRMPAIAELVKSLTGKEPNKTVNPDEVVALGAAIQGGVIEGTVGHIVLVDVTPLTLGVEVAGGLVSPIIPRNTAIPTQQSRVYSTAEDNQPNVEIHIVQGERAYAGDNNTLGKFLLDQLPPAPAGVVQVEVTFDIDVNGIVKVSAKDLGTGRKQDVVVKNSSSFSEADIKRMVSEAERHAAEDTARRDAEKARLESEAAISRAKRLLDSKSPHVAPATEAELSRTISALSPLPEGDSLVSGLAALQAAVHAYSTEMYAGAAANREEAGDE